MNQDSAEKQFDSNSVFVEDDKKQEHIESNTISIEENIQAEQTKTIPFEDTAEQKQIKSKDIIV